MKPPRRRFFWRVYLNGLLLLILIGLALFTVSLLFGPTPDEGHGMARLLEYVGTHIDEARSDPARLARELSRALEAVNAEVTVYQAGAPPASNVAPPLPPLSAEDAGRLGGVPSELPDRSASSAMRLAGDPPAYAIFQKHHHGFPSPWRTAAVIAGILVALAIASIPLARAVASPLERLGRAVTALGAGDLSARAGLRRTDEIGALATAFDEMAQTLQRSIASEKVLLANISHELRTPLTRIRVALDLLDEEDLGAAAAFVRGIASDLSELERLVDDILTTARLDLAASRTSGGELPLRFAPVDVAQLLRDAAERFRAAHGDRILNMDIGEHLPAVRGDAVLLRRVVENLLDNARKYSDAGAPIAIRADAVAGSVLVEVQDRGIGLDEDDLARLFTPFFRTDRSRARGTRGVGLGLALSRRIIEAHGGAMTVASVPGEGSTFRFELRSD
ncbi:MAG TPA: HAMP domain-containing sensor histidine kinase [Haliangiales bacterium]|nr:HAMP domain-containing sensor histidine kinase [Haliangiales bacterium]